MNRQAAAPAVAAAYFARYAASALLADRPHPIISQTFVPGRGWRRYPVRKRVSGNCLRQLRAAGVTEVALTAHGRTADFRVAELLVSQ